MTRNDYEAYLAAFNARDYDAVLEFYGPDPEIRFAGYCLRGRDAVRSFYAFFHRYVRESITYDRLIANDQMLVIEAVVRLEAIDDLTPQLLAAQGLARLFPLKAGQVIEVPQFIHYDLDQGKFVRAICTVIGAERR